MKGGAASGHEPDMKEGRPDLPLLLVLLLAAAGCEQGMIVGIEPGGAGGSGGSTGTAGSTGSTGTAGSTGSTGTAGSTGSTGTSRLTGPQSGMVGVTSPGGVTYYIDSTEVSQAAYALFLASSPVPDTDSSACGWKTTFAPGMEPNASYTGAVNATECRPENPVYDPVGHGDDPVVCVDYCDAVAYCLWAGKRLCGHIGGGPASEDDYTNASGSQWYNACSNAGTTPFPYGPSYVAGECNDGTAVAAVGGMPGCHGAAPPFDGIFDMSGNVQEWDDTCQVNPFAADGGTGAGQMCALRGGGFFVGGPPPMGGPFNFVAASMICGTMLDGMQFGVQFGPRNLENQALGFRCCAD